MDKLRCRLRCIQLDSHMNLELQLEMCLNETYSRVRVGKDLCDMFHIGNGVKQGDAISPCFSTVL